MKIRNQQWTGQYKVVLGHLILGFGEGYLENDIMRKLRFIQQRFENDAYHEIKLDRMLRKIRR